MEENTIDLTNIRSWWNSKSNDDRTWLMMKYGFDPSFESMYMNSDDITKIYKSEYGY